MMKYILLLLTICLSAGPLSANNAEFSDDSSEVQSVIAQQNAAQIKLTVRGKSVRVQNASGLTMDVYSLTGAKVTSVKIDASDKSISLNVSQGIYIIKVGNVVRKVSLS